MKKVIIHAEVYTGETVIADGFVRFGKEIGAVGKMSEYVPEPGEEVIDAAGSRLVPGFIDVHSHGGYGADNMDGDADAINRMIAVMHQEGITSYFPTTMTQSSENIEQALIGIRKAAEQNPVIQGIHLEGPFISAVFKGAQPEEHIKAPDAALMKKWQELSGGLIRLVTYAPETTDATAFEQYCTKSGIVLSVGHSNAVRSQLQQSKATHITHLYNAQRGLHHREPGVTGHAFLEDGIYAEMIVDGLHIDPEMVKIAFRQKGADRIELITDAMRAKGMGDGISELGGQTVIVKDREARLESGNLAGSVLEFQDAFSNIIAFTGCSISDAVKMSSVNQAREFGLSRKGGIAPGKDADMVLLSESFAVERTISYGKTVFKKTESRLQNMEIIIKANPEEASRYAFEKIQAEMANGAKVLGLATGSTPVRLYRIMRESDLDFSGMTSINLDEYMGLSEDNPQSYHHFMHKHLFDAKPFKQNYLLDGMADEVEECAQFEAIIAANPIDVQILGIGTNGHIGFNEPGTSFDSRTRKVALWQSTIDSNKRFFADEKDVPRFAYSMGIQSILSSRQIILMAFGKEKAAAVKAALEGPVTEDLPASVLQTHKHVTVILDEEAAEMLTKKQ